MAVVETGVPKWMTRMMVDGILTLTENYSLEAITLAIHTLARIVALAANADRRESAIEQIHRELDAAIADQIVSVTEDAAMEGATHAKH